MNCRLACALGLVAVLAGCASKGPSDPAEALLTERADATAEVCRCASHLGLSVDECLEAFGFAGVGGQTVTEPVLACVERAYDRDAETYERPFTCQAKAAKQLRRCAAKVHSCDPDALAICIDSYYVTLEQCERIPDAVDHEVVACLDGLPADPVAAYMNRLRSAQDVACQCDPEAYDAKTTEECRGTEATWACVERVAREHEAELTGAYFCQAVRYQRYLDCVREDPSCDAVDYCVEDVSFEDCDAVPDDVFTEMNDCFR